MSVRLLGGTGLPDLDRVLRGLVTLAERLVPGRVWAYYAHGSHVTGTAHPASDLDLVVVLRPGTQAAVRPGLEATFAACSLVSPVLLDASVVAAEDLARLGAGWLREAVLLFGEDVRPDHPDPPPAVAVRQRMYGTFATLTRRYPSGVPLPHPLTPAGVPPLCGFDRGVVRLPTGEDVPGTGEVVSVVASLAKTLVLRRTGALPPGKGEGLAAVYRDAVGDGWDALVEAVFRRLRRDWGYRIPDGAADRRELEEMAGGVIRFQDRFVAEFVAFLFEELRDGDELRRLRAVAASGEAGVADGAVLAAVEEAGRAGGELAGAAGRTLAMLGRRS